MTVTPGGRRPPTLTDTYRARSTRRGQDDHRRRPGTQGEVTIDITVTTACPPDFVIPAGTGARYLAADLPRDRRRDLHRHRDRGRQLQDGERHHDAARRHDRRRRNRTADADRHLHVRPRLADRDQDHHRPAAGQQGSVRSTSTAAPRSLSPTSPSRPAPPNQTPRSPASPPAPCTVTETATAPPHSHVTSRRPQTSASPPAAQRPPISPTPTPSAPGSFSSANDRRVRRRRYRVSHDPRAATTA